MPREGAVEGVAGEHLGVVILACGKAGQQGGPVGVVVADGGDPFERRVILGQVDAVAVATDRLGRPLVGAVVG